MRLGGGGRGNSVVEFQEGYNNLKVGEEVCARRLRHRRLTPEKRESNPRRPGPALSHQRPASGA
ncbi:hypothetical protein FKM82_006785 [Ascaphus truei]